MYDNEGGDTWDTPQQEKNDPWTYMQKFGQFAHARFFQALLAPGRDLGLVTTSVNPKHDGETLNDWYLRTRIAETAGRYGDIFDVQDQANTTTGDYQSFMANASGQANGANDFIYRLAGISTKYGTAQQMATAAKSINPGGYWLNVPDGDIAKAVAFLRLMQ